MSIDGAPLTAQSVTTQATSQEILTNTETIIAAVGLIEQAGIPEYTGTARYVSPNGDNSDGLTWAKALHTITAALAASSERDVVLAEGGYTYDESATLNGLVCNVNKILIESIGVDRAVITNTDVTNDGAAVTVTGRGITMRNFNIRKGEVASLNSAALRFDGAISSRAENCVMQVGNAATHVAAHFDGGAGGCVVIGDDPTTSGCAGIGIGTGVHFENAVRCAIASTGIGVTTTGVHFDASALLCSVDDKSLIQNTTTGISLSAGASLNILSARILASTTAIADLSGNATNIRSGSPTALYEDVSHIPQFTGAIRFVDGGAGIDTNSGLSPATAFATIGAAIAASGAGDAITTKAAIYTENGLDLNLDGLELWCEIGTHIEPPGASTCMVVSGNHCRVVGLHVEKVGQTGIQVTGDGCSIEWCHSTAAVAFDIDGDDNDALDCAVHTPGTTGFDVSGVDNRIRRASVTGDGSATRGYLLSGSAANNTIRNSDSVGNATAGFEAESGTSYNTIAFCSSGGGDGSTIDDGQYNNWPGYVGQLATEQHEDIYPLSNGQGVAGDPVTVSNATTDGGGGQRDDQNYWGDITRIIPPDTIATRWLSVGIYLHATTTADIQQWETLFTYANAVSAQNGGNDWGENEVDLTVVDGSIFENGDHVWVTGNDRVEGEIMLVSGAPAGNVVTLARETTADGEAGLRYNYDATAVNNRMYVVKRVGSGLYHGFEGDFSAGSARDHERYPWHKPKQIAPNGGMLMRMLNASDALGSEFDVRAIYED